jgi:hypothetical protein
VLRISVCFSFDVVAARSALRILGLEEEVAASCLDAEKLYYRLNDLEDRHEALSRETLDVVQVLRPEGLLLPDHLRSLPRQVTDAVVLGIRRGLLMRWPWCRLSLAGTWASWSPGSRWRLALRNRGCSSSGSLELPLSSPQRLTSMTSSQGTPTQAKMTLRWLLQRM